MLKREIKYKDFDGEDAVEIAYFNLSKTELVNLEAASGEGLQVMLTRIIKSDNQKAMIQEFQKIILLAYGVRSEDGKRFVKSDEIREAFSQTAAYDALFIELATSDDLAVKFIEGILPDDMMAFNKDKPQLPTPDLSTAVPMNDPKE